MQDSVQAGGVTKVMDTDMAEAAVCLYKKLDSGTREREGETMGSCTIVERKMYWNLYCSIFG